MKIKSHNHNLSQINQQSHNQAKDLISKGKNIRDIRDQKENVSIYLNAPDNKKPNKIITRNHKKNTLKQNISTNTHSNASTSAQHNEINQSLHNIPNKTQHSRIIQVPLQAPLLPQPRSLVHRNDCEQKHYLPQILLHMKKKSQNSRISASYLRNHENLTRQHRCSFIKHFFRLQKRFSLARKTIFLAVFVMDSYLEKCVNIEKKQATLCALASIFIAMKYEEIYPPELHEWTQPHSDIIHFQSKILSTLNFNLTVPTIQNYLEYFLDNLQTISSNTSSNQPTNNIASSYFCSTSSTSTVSNSSTSTAANTGISSVSNGTALKKEMIKMLGNICLFDENILYSYNSYELSLALVYSIVDRSKIEQKTQMSLKWMMQRNEKYVIWVEGLKNESKNYKYVGN